MVTLQVEQGGEIAMIDADGSPRGMAHGGLGMKHNADAGGRQHRDVVGAVADGNDFVTADAKAGGKLIERRKLGIAAENRSPHRAGEPAVSDVELVGPMLVEAKRCRDAGGEGREAARYRTV